VIARRGSTAAPGEADHLLDVSETFYAVTLDCKFPNAIAASLLKVATG